MEGNRISSNLATGHFIQSTEQQQVHLPWSNNSPQGGWLPADNCGDDGGKGKAVVVLPPVPESGFTKAQQRMSTAADADNAAAGGGQLRHRQDAEEGSSGASWRSLLRTRFSKPLEEGGEGAGDNGSGGLPQALPEDDSSSISLDEHGKAEACGSDRGMLDKLMVAEDEEGDGQTNVSAGADFEVDKYEMGSGGEGGRGRGPETSAALLVTGTALERMGLRKVAQGRDSSGDDGERIKGGGGEAEGEGGGEGGSEASMSAEEAHGVKCHKCGQAFPTEAALDLLHASAKCLACKTCGRLFASTAALGQHMSMSHGLGRFSRSSSSLMSYDNMAEAACVFNCHLCQRQFKSGTALFQHAAAAHSGLSSGQHPAENGGAPDPDKPFSCRHCMKKFKTVQAAERHTRDKHKIITGECPSTILGSLQISRRPDSTGRPGLGAGGGGGGVAGMRPLLAARGLHMMNMPALLASGIVPQAGSEMVRAGVLHAIQHMARKEARLPMLPRVHVGADGSKIVQSPTSLLAKRPPALRAPYVRTITSGGGGGQVLRMPMTAPVPQQQPPPVVSPPILPPLIPGQASVGGASSSHVQPGPLMWTPVYQPVMTEWGMQMSVVYQPVYAWTGNQSQ